MFKSLSALAGTFLLCAGAQAQTIKRVSVSIAGVQSNDHSYAAGWHPSGCCVVFYTQATNLFSPPDPNKATYVAMANVTTGAVTDLSRGIATGLTGAATFTNLLCESRPKFSADGNKLVFYAQAANGLVKNDTAKFLEVFVKTIKSGKVIVLTSPGGVNSNDQTYSPLMSPDGSTAGFSSYATNLLGSTPYRAPALILANTTTGALSLTSVNASGVSEDGGAGTPAFSPDGKMIGWGTNSSNIVPVPVGSTNVFVKVLATGALTLVSATQAGAPSDGLSTHPDVSHSGRYVAFQSNAPAFGGDGVIQQVYIKDLQTGALTLASTDATGKAGTANSTHGQWSPDDTRLLMESAAPNMVPGVQSGSTEIVIKDLATGTVTLVSKDTTGLPAVGNSNHPQWSPSGKMVSFASTAQTLVAGDTNRKADVFVATLP